MLFLQDFEYLLFLIETLFMMIVLRRRYYERNKQYAINNVTPAYRGFSSCDVRYAGRQRSCTELGPRSNWPQANSSPDHFGLTITIPVNFDFRSGCGNQFDDL